MIIKPPSAPEVNRATAREEISASLRVEKLLFALSCARDKIGSPIIFSSPVSRMLFSSILFFFSYQKKKEKRKEEKSRYISRNIYREIGVSICLVVESVDETDKIYI